MTIAVTGANGAAGKAVLRQVASGQEVGVRLIATVRSERAAREVQPLLRASDRVAVVAYEDASRVRAALGGVDAVVHLAGVLVESRNASYATANVLTARATVEAARACGVRKLVLVSAVGASETSPNGYWRSKGLAEALVRRSGLSYTVLRVPLLLGRGTAAAVALRHRVRRRTVVLVAGGRTRQRPLHVDDLARAVLRAARPDVAENLTLDLVGPAPVTDREILERAARQLGRQVRVRSMPYGLARLALAIRRRLLRTGLSTDVLEVLTGDTVADPEPAVGALGVELTSVDEMIRQSLAGGS